MPLSPVIAARRPTAYGAGMAARVLRLLSLVALLLMPFGMSHAPAVASPAAHATAEGHCGEHQPPADLPSPPEMACAMMCAMIPADEVAAPEPALLPAPPRLIAGAPDYRGIVPEIATPPPRSA